MRQGNLVAAHAVGGTGLGFYVKAYSLVLLPLRQINGPLSTVVVPMLSRMQGEADRFRAYYCKALGLTAMRVIEAACQSAVLCSDPA